MKVLFPAILNKVGSLKDRSYKLEFVTRELRGADAANLFSNLMDEGWVIWAPADEMPGETDVPVTKADAGLETKSAGQRFRARLFVYYREVKKGEPATFNSWYESELEKLGQAYLEKVHD